jgi:ribosomal protein S27E
MNTKTVEATDLELLVGEMPDVPCEHSAHGTGFGSHDLGPATHYLRGSCPRCSRDVIFAACSEFVAFAKSNSDVSCYDCGHTSSSSEVLRILGPVRS